MEPKQDTLTVLEAGIEGRCHPGTVTRAIREGQLKATLSFNRYLIDRPDFEQWLSRKRQDAARREEQ